MSDEVLKDGLAGLPEEIDLGHGATVTRRALVLEAQRKSGWSIAQWNALADEEVARLVGVELEEAKARAAWHAGQKPAQGNDPGPAAQGPAAGAAPPAAATAAAAAGASQGSAAAAAVAAPRKPKAVRVSPTAKVDLVGEALARIGELIAVLPPLPADAEDERARALAAIAAATAATGGAA